jgi:hypothetical protein
MKKAMSGLFAAALVLTAYTSNAQQIGSVASSVNPVYGRYEAPAAEKTLAASEVNATALTHFTSHNKSASGAVWTANGNLQSVYFTSNNARMRSTYNEKGKLQYTLGYYTLAQSPKSIRDLVKADYSKMTVVLVTEVNRRGKEKYHLVKMEDEKSFLTIRVLNGETELYEKITKK